MLREFIQGKLDRATEAGHLMAKYAADPGSAKTLAACYASILRTTTDPTEVEFDLRVLGQDFHVHMRKCDIFTIAEIFHEKQYALRSPVAPGGVVVDAGANIGVAAMWFLARYPGSQLYAFEPEPTNFRFLSSNLQHLSQVTLEQAALGAEDGTAQLSLASHGAEHSLKEQHGGDTVDVPVVALGPYLRAKGVDHIELLKTDIEGAEMDMLLGLGDLIDGVQVIVGECHERYVDEAKFYAWLEDRGFRRVSKEYFGNGEADGVHAFEVSR